MANRLVTLLLSPASLLFGVIVWLRNLAYTKGWLRSYTVPAPVVSVGNLTVGGTGKTPMVIALAGFFMEQGYHVGIVSRGFRRKSRGVRLVSDGKTLFANAQESGDEPYLMAEQLRRAVVIVGEDRVSAARMAVDRFGCNLILADDAFQHRRLHRDADVVLWAADQNPKGQFILPSGRLREPLNAIRRADFLLFTRAATLPVYHRCFEQYGHIRHQASVPMYLQAIWDIRNNEVIRELTFKNQRILAFCGLGCPEQFFEAIKRLEPEIIDTITFPDHHAYSSRDVKRILRGQQKKNDQYLVTTRKDWIKLKTIWPSERPLYVVEMELRPDPIFLQQLLHTIRQHSRKALAKHPMNDR